MSTAKTANVIIGAFVRDVKSRLLLAPAGSWSYHFGKTDTSKLVELPKGVKGMAERIRRMQ